MKVYILSLVLLLLAALPLMAQQSDISATFSPASIRVNSFNTASFDPNAPESQPIITTLTVRNVSAQSYRFNLKLDITWNQIDLTNAEFISVNELMPGQNLILSSRDLITNESSTYFEEIGIGGVTLSEVLDANPILRDAVLSGSFPDGNLRLEVYVKPETGSYSGVPDAVFTIEVRNAGNITLISPGVPIGTNPSEISSVPITFYWNAINTGFNDYYLYIREFSSNMPPNSGNVENTGDLFYTSSALAGGSFSDYLNYVPGNYYAWKVSTRLYTDSSPLTRERGAGSLDSNWYVFRFMPSNESPAITINELQALLQSLNSPEMEALFSGGFAPIGSVQADGQNYTGEEALNIIRNLFGRNIFVEIRN